MNQIETAEATPEELLKMLETQLAVTRARSQGVRRHRAALLVGGLLFIFIAAGLALVVLGQMVADLPQRAAARPTSPAAPNPGNF